MAFIKLRGADAPAEVMALRDPQFFYNEVTIPQLCSVARNITTPINTLRKLVDYCDVRVRRALVDNPMLPMEELYAMVMFEDDCEVRRIAQLNYARRKLLEEPEKLQQVVVLKDGSRVEITERYAKYINKDGKLLHKVIRKRLTGEEELAYRQKEMELQWKYIEKVEDADVPIELLIHWAENDNPVLRKRAVENPNTPFGVFVCLFADEKVGVREEVAKSIRSPAEILTELSEDTSEWVRDAVAGNPNTLDKIVSKLCKDDNEFVREQAKEERARRKNK